MGIRTGFVACAALVLVGAPPSAIAHEGHGDATWHNSLLHYFIEPVHLPLMLVVLVVLVLAARWVSNRAASRNLRHEIDHQILNVR